MILLQRLLSSPIFLHTLEVAIDDDILEQQRRWKQASRVNPAWHCLSAGPSFWSPDGSGNGTSGQGAGAWWPPGAGLERQGLSPYSSSLSPGPNLTSRGSGKDNWSC